MLYTHVCKITFKKKDGSIRELIGTLNSYLLDRILEYSGSYPSTHPSHLQVVYDLENDGWRSYIKDNLVSIEPLVLIDSKDDPYEIMRSLCH